MDINGVKDFVEEKIEKRWQFLGMLQNVDDTTKEPRIEEF